MNRTSFQSIKPQLREVWRLSLPAILTQITTIAMQYIDSAMVGRLGANASAAIGIVASSTWLMNGVCYALAAGFSVQVAHRIGAGNEKEAIRIVFSFILHGLERIPYVFLIFLIRHAIPFIMGSQHFHSCFAFLHQPVCNTRQEVLALKWIFRQCLLQERRQAALQFLHHALGKSPEIHGYDGILRKLRPSGNARNFLGNLERRLPYRRCHLRGA